MLKPLSNRLVLQQVKEEEKKAGGLLLTSSSKVNDNMATVVAVADDVKTVKVGDVVVFEPFSALTITDDGIDYTVVKLEQVVAIVE